MYNDSISGHIVHYIIIVLYSIVYIEIVGTHFHNYCAKIILHNADSISAVVPRKAFPTLNMLLLYNKFRAESIKRTFLKILYTIPSQCNSLIFLNHYTTCFGHRLPSSGDRCQNYHTTFVYVCSRISC
jgi:hypothetical protein